MYWFSSSCISISLLFLVFIRFFIVLCWFIMRFNALEKDCSLSGWFSMYSMFGSVRDTLLVRYIVFWFIIVVNVVVVKNLLILISNFI